MWNTGTSIWGASWNVRSSFGHLRDIFCSCGMWLTQIELDSWVFNGYVQHETDVEWTAQDEKGMTSCRISMWIGNGSGRVIGKLDTKDPWTSDQNSTRREWRGNLLSPLPTEGSPCSALVNNGSHRNLIQTSSWVCDIQARSFRIWSSRASRNRQSSGSLRRVIVQRHVLAATSESYKWSS